MGMYSYVRDLWKKPKENLGVLYQQRLIEWRRQEATVRVERPTRIDRARSLGYKAKLGFVVVRQRVPRGGHWKPKPAGGRRPKRFGQRMTLDRSYQTIAEQRANNKYPNCEVLNSYWVGEDGKFRWFEVILLDKSHPSILADPRTAWVAHPAQRARVYRGLTSSGKRTRRSVQQVKGRS